MAADNLIDDAIRILRDHGVSVKPSRCELIQRNAKRKESFVQYIDKSTKTRWAWIPPKHKVPWHRHDRDETARVIYGSGGAVVGEPPIEGPCRILMPGSTLRVSADEWHNVGAGPDGLLLTSAAIDRKTQWHSDLPHEPIESVKPKFQSSTIKVYSALKRKRLLLPADDVAVQQVIQNALFPNLAPPKRKRSESDSDEDRRAWDRACLDDSDEAPRIKRIKIRYN